MNILVSGVAAATLLMGLSTASLAIEHCPAASAISQDSAGIYTAKGEKGNWTSKTPVNKLDLGRASFQKATVLQADENSPQKFQTCVYKADYGMSLDIYFVPKNEEEFTVKTEGDSWKKEPGYFGSISYVCENTQPENCTFSLVQ
ncbi:Protein of unknown function [Pseudomonas asturiensis]|uniref:DUF3757 domain-containing protein n=1 Tax=Pseudomonas asturiensis TaxID=1190415 RepID=A0A1M7PWV7_9PSED|nr:DUF3757 domain-containing protein [Pseudomonas asturiensis]SHN22103.1 Protein of unknown function [Pseudomonas asturiensis]